jgi:hypothetical protein
MNRDAEKIRGRGDAKAAFENTQDTMLLEPNSDFFKYFSKQQ